MDTSATEVDAVGGCLQDSEEEDFRLEDRILYYPRIKSSVDSEGVIETSAEQGTEAFISYPG